MTTEPLLSPSVLDELRTAHAGVRVCLAEMAALTSRSEVARTDYTQARLRISQASLKRRASFNAACFLMRQGATSDTRAIIEELLRRDRELSAKSANHIRDWTAERIAADWKGYCAASRDIRGEMEQELSAEQTMLFPLLAAGRH